MDLKLTGKTALVTGSSSGIGRAAAIALAGEGVQVVVHGRNQGRAEAVASEIRANGGLAQIVLGDLANTEDCTRIAAEAEGAFGRVDILVNNSGAGGGPGRWFDHSADHWRELVEANALGSVRLIHALVPAMKARGWGRVINVGSSSSVRPSADFPAYSASKGIIVNLTVSLSMELGGSGVTANLVSPGGTRTDAMIEGLTALANAQGWPETEFDDIERRAVRELFPCPAGRLARPEEVAAVIAFVASEQAGYMTGANVRVDGGFCESVA